MSLDLRVRVASSMDEVAPADWDALAGMDDPFVEHAFLAVLERAGCVGPEAGWQPAHVLVERVDDGRLVGAAPAYVKDNSYGEYIFDWGWAEAAQRAGLAYYPKVVVAVPYTPATGPRLLVAPDADRARVGRALAQGARELADVVDAQSVHWLFAPDDQADLLAAAGYDRRLSYQFHWTDAGYGDFEGFLGALTSKRRKEIRRERRQAQELGLDIAVEHGEALSGDDVRRMHRCYLATLDQRWSRPYLTPAWFERLRTDLAPRVRVVTARRDGVLVAMALAFAKGHHLYGRYWGTLEDLPALHFECCYYQLVEHALAHGYTRVEAGAQGRHKLPRGFLPAATHSAHWLRHGGLAQAVHRFLDEEAAAVRAEMGQLAARGPYRAPAKAAS